MKKKEDAVQGSEGFSVGSECLQKYKSSILSTWLKGNNLDSNHSKGSRNIKKDGKMDRMILTN